MRFIFLGAVLVALGVVEVGHFPILIAKIIIQVIQGYADYAVPLRVRLMFAKA